MTRRLGVQFDASQEKWLESSAARPPDLRAQVRDCYWLEFKQAVRSDLNFQWSLYQMFNLGSESHEIPNIPGE